MTECDILIVLKGRLRYRLAELVVDFSERPAGLQLIIPTVILN